MEWINPLDEIPPDHSYVAALRYHWKKCWPLSAEIIFGDVESYICDAGFRIARINTNDFTGSGSYCWYFPSHDYWPNSDVIVAWCYAKEFQKPKFIEHDFHWGKEKS